MSSQDVLASNNSITYIQVPIESVQLLKLLLGASGIRIRCRQMSPWCERKLICVTAPLTHHRLLHPTHPSSSRRVQGLGFRVYWVYNDYCCVATTCVGVKAQVWGITQIWGLHKANPLHNPFLVMLSSKAITWYKDNGKKKKIFPQQWVGFSKTMMKIR